MLEGLELLVGLGLVGEEGVELKVELAHGHADLGGGDGELLFDGGNVVVGGLAGDGFEAAGAGGDCSFGDDFNEADFAGGGNVGAAAEFAAVTASVHDAHGLAVFLAEEGEGAFGFFVELGFVGGDGGVFEDALVDETLDLTELGGSDGLEVGEIEAETVGGVERAGLADVRAEDFAQGPVEEVGRGVVAVDGAAAGRGDGERRTRVEC